MTFNTGNNVPSTDPRDLYDNAENLDKLVNGADPFYADRKGVLRESWAGMENTFDTSQTGRENAFALSQDDKESRFQAFLVSSGYVSKGDYAANVVLAERNEYVAVDAATTGTSAGLYRPNASATLPLTLTGVWATDSANLVLLGDDVLRQELAADAGAGKVGWLRSPLADAISSVAQMLNSQHVNVWEFVSGVVSDSFDWTAAFQAAVDYMASAGGGFVYVPPQSTTYRITPQADGAAINMKGGVFLIGAGAASALELVTAADEQPNTSVNWDAVLFSGAAVVNAGIERVRIAHSGGARNNCASIAVRGGAAHIRVMHNIVENSIGSGVIIEGSVASPYPTNCKIHYNRISGCRRHGTYLSGATHNDVRFNFYQNTQLETFAVRNASDNDIERNDVFGDGASYPSGGVALAAPPTGIYVNSRVNVRHNRFVNLPNHALYGQGVGATLRDSDWSDNTIEAMRAADTTSHAVMIYRASGCKFNRNKVYGGRNRGMMFYGCSDNEIVGNLISDTNDAGNSVGTLFLASYTDSADSTTTHSQRNRIDGNSILDNRATAKHYYGVQILADNTGNVIGRNRIAGLASGGAEYSAPDWSAQVVGVNVEDFSFRYDALASGSTASTAAKALGNMTAISIAEAGSLRSLSLYTGQIVTGGTITVTIYVNGVSVGSVTLTGDGSIRRAAQYLAPGARKVVPGDVLTAFVSASSMTTDAASVDLGIRVTTSQ